VFAVLGVGVVSVLAPLPQSPDVSVTAPGSAGDAPGGDDSGMEPTGKDADLVDAAPTAPDSGPAQTDDLSKLDGADTQPAALPEVGGPTSGLEQPQQPGQTPQVDADQDAPVVSVAPGGAPAAPSDESELSISTVPAQPSVPDVSDAGSGFGTQTPQVEDTPTVSTTQDPERSGDDTVATPAPPTAGTSPEAATESAAAPDPNGAGPDQPAVAQDGTGAQPAASAEQPVQTPTSPGQAPAQPAAAPQQPVAPEPDAQEEQPRVAALPQSGGEAETPSGPTIGKPVKPLTERGNNSTLPVANEAETATTETPAVPPIVQYATAFENPEGRPLLSIILIDDEKSFGSEALEDFPYPLTFAVNAAASDAPEKMARHRAAGFEVVALLDLPVGSTAQDAEVALSASFDRLPETVAILEGVGSGIQGNRGLSDQVTAIADATGRGLITQSNGLNTVQKLAARAGIPSAIVFRDFDGAGQTASVMRRFLDQAAFRAGQEGAVIMLGRVRPETISALLLWGLQDRAARVSLAPVSAVLLRAPE